MSDITPTNEPDNVKRLLPPHVWDKVKKANAAIAEIKRILKENENKINQNE